MVESSRIRFAYINVGPGCRAIDIGVPVGDNNVKEHRGRDSEDNNLEGASNGGNRFGRCLKRPKRFVS